MKLGNSRRSRADFSDVLVAVAFAVAEVTS